jgi:IclR family acetate operon transcriptional repressor
MNLAGHANGRSPTGGSKTGHGAQTADRAIQVLLLVAQSEEPLSLAEISQRTGFNTPATYRLVQVLTKHSLLARDRDGRSYTAGGGLVALAASVMSRLDLPEVATPAMERLRALTAETVSLYVRDDRHRICVAVVEGLHRMRWVVPVGDRQPLYVGLTGKAILAFLAEPEIDDVLAAAEHEGADMPLLEEQLARVRSTGFLAGVGDRVAGVGGLSAPVFDAAGVTAALTVSGPFDRFSEQVAEETAPALLAETAAISAALGAAPLPAAESGLR